MSRDRHHRRLLKWRPGYNTIHRSDGAQSSGRTPLAVHGQARVVMVPLLIHSSPLPLIHPRHCQTTRPLSIHITTRLQNAETIRPVVAEQRESGKETRGCNHIPQTPQQVILAASASDIINILSAPTQSLHHFLNEQNTTALQADCDLT